MNKDVKIVAVGDLCVNRDDPDSIFDLVRPEIKKADFAFGQIETTYSTRGAVNPSGTYVTLRADPKNVEGVARAGFNVASFASNHCMDFGFDALADTIKHFEDAGVRVIGAGNNLAEARKPLIVEKNGTKIGWLAYCSILHPRYWADVERPGCAPARARTLYETLEIDQPGTPPRILTYPNDEDLEAILSDIANLKKQVDLVIVSMHWGLHFKEAELAMYERTYAHKCIDGGADVILGHHAHILKPIEIYKGKPIFYCLANFAFDIEYPKDEWSKPERVERRSRLNASWTGIDPKYKTFPFPVDSRKTILVDIVCEKNTLKRVSWKPAMINENSQPRCLKQGEPEFAEVLEYMTRITRKEKLNTEFRVEGDDVVLI